MLRIFRGSVSSHETRCIHQSADVASEEVYRLRPGMSQGHGVGEMKNQHGRLRSSSQQERRKARTTLELLKSVIHWGKCTRTVKKD